MTLLTVLAFAFSSGLDAQAVRGTVVDSITQLPSRSFTVVLLDETGAVVGGTVAGPRGEFALVAPAPGNYRLRVQRVGFVNTVSDSFLLSAGVTLETRLAVTPVRVSLAAIRVTEITPCITLPNEGLASFVLWDEVRKALYATTLAQNEGLVRLTVEDYERELDSEGRRLRKERRSQRSGVSENPYVSLSADKLAARGYVQRDSGFIWYYAPDAHVLLSDTFLADHCLRLEHADSTVAKGLIGVGFEPVAARKVPDIRGVLWMDERTAELRYIDFIYTSLDWKIRGEYGGRVEFDHLPTGEWIVSKWMVRAPIFRLEQRRRFSNVSLANPSDRFETYVEEVLTGVKEEGGQVIAARIVSKSSSRLDSGPTSTYADPTREDSLAAPTSPEPRHWRSGFQERRATARGRFLTRSDIAFRKAKRTTDLIEGMPGISLRKVGSPHFDYIVTTSRSRMSYPDVCTVTFFVDGVQQVGDLRQLFVNKAVQPSEVEAVEVYSDPAYVPLIFPRIEEACGVVAIWRRAANETHDVPPRGQPPAVQNNSPHP